MLGLFMVPLLPILGEDVIVAEEERETRGLTAEAGDDADKEEVVYRFDCTTCSLDRLARRLTDLEPRGRPVLFLQIILGELSKLMISILSGIVVSGPKPWKGGEEATNSSKVQSSGKKALLPFGLGVSPGNYRSRAG